MSGGFANDYLAARGEGADRVFDFRNEDDKPRRFYVLVFETHTNKPLVWAVPNLLTNDEYNFVRNQISQGPFGKDSSQELHVPDLFGDANNDSVLLSEELLPRLQHDYDQHKELRPTEDSDNDEFYSIATTWRVLKLEGGQEFPAHQDAMDSIPKDSVFAVSTHSVLMEFHHNEESSSPASSFDDDNEEDVSTDISTASSSSSSPREMHRKASSGGATRFYYRQYPFDGPYDYCVDVHLPPGWAIVMEQRPDLWYALQPSSARAMTTRYVAQAGMLQAMHPGETVESKRKGSRGAFSLGPGLLELFEDEVEDCLGVAPAWGWGQHGVNPKSTLWRDGRPIVSPTMVMPSQRERRWSMVHSSSNPLLMPNSKPRRRQSLQCQVDPIRQRVSYTVPGPLRAVIGKKKSDHHCVENDESVTSFTADFTESVRSFDDDYLMHFSFSGIPYHPPKPSEDSRCGGVQVTRKPRRDSLVGKLMDVYQHQASSSAAPAMTVEIPSGSIVQPEEVKDRVEIGPLEEPLHVGEA